MPNFHSLAAVIAASVCALAATQLPISSHAPLPAHTGGFGEPDCRSCHFDYPLNEAGVTIALDSLPTHYTPAQKYSLRLLVRHAELKRGGFQLSARSEDGSPAGQLIVGDSTLLRVQSARGIAYLSHTAAGADHFHASVLHWK